MSHIFVPIAEEILDKEFPVLNKGFVRLVDYMGGDSRIAAAARCSTGKQDKIKTEEDDKKLIFRLMEDGHTSPFEMVEFLFHAKMPIFVARQWIRHRTANVNEWSGRYSVLKDEFYIPDFTDIKYQSNTNKQGRAEDEVPYELKQKVLEILLNDQENVYHSYEEMLEDNISRELARINLPLSIYTQWYWKIDLHNLLHFLKLRLDLHSQKEIRDYAEVMSQMAKAVAPMTYEAFEEFNLYSVKFSKTEIKALHSLLYSGKYNINEMLNEKQLNKFEKKLGLID